MHAKTTAAKLSTLLYDSSSYFSTQMLSALVDGTDENGWGVTGGPGKSVVITSSNGRHPENSNTYTIKLPVLSFDAIFQLLSFLSLSKMLTSHLENEEHDARKTHENGHGTLETRPSRTDET